MVCLNSDAILITTSQTAVNGYGDKTDNCGQVEDPVLRAMKSCLLLQRLEILSGVSELIFPELSLSPENIYLVPRELKIHFYIQDIIVLKLADKSQPIGLIEALSSF